MSDTGRPIRVLLCEDEAMMQNLIRVAVESCEDIELVGSAENGSDGVGLALECEPDVVVMDVMMPRFDGVEATKRIRQALPQTRILIFTGDTHTELIERAFAAGAVGYVPKPEIAPLIAAIRQIAQGHSVLNFPPKRD